MVIINENIAILSIYRPTLPTKQWLQIDHYLSYPTKCNSEIRNNYFFFRYKNTKRFGTMGYEEDFLRYLQTLLSDVDRRIRRGHSRLSTSAELMKVSMEQL